MREGDVAIPYDKVHGFKFHVEPMPAWGRSTQGKLYIRCKCGVPMGLEDHTIEDNGTVNPSLHHDDPECGWHVWGTLVDWDKKGHQT